MTFSEYLEHEAGSIAQRMWVQFADYDPQAQVHIMYVPAGTVVLKQGEARSSLYVLLSGRVAVVSQQTPQTSYAFYEYRPIEVFGDQEVLAGFPNIIADVRTTTTCRFLILQEADYTRWLLSDVTILQKRVRSIISTLLQQTDREQRALFMDSKTRLAIFCMVYYESHIKSEEDVKGVVVRQGRNAIAEQTGFSLRTVNRAIEYFKKHNLIKIVKGKMFITPEQYKQLKKYFKSVKM